MGSCPMDFSPSRPNPTLPGGATTALVKHHRGGCRPGATRGYPRAVPERMDLGYLEGGVLGMGMRGGLTVEPSGPGLGRNGNRNRNGRRRGAFPIGSQRTRWLIRSGRCCSGCSVERTIRCPHVCPFFFSVATVLDGLLCM